MVPHLRARSTLVLLVIAASTMLAACGTSGAGGAEGGASDVVWLDWRLDAPRDGLDGAKDLFPFAPDSATDQTEDRIVDTLPAELDGQDVGVDAAPACEPGAGVFGCPCRESGDCLSSFCLWHLGDRMCSMLCEVSCPPGWTCGQIHTTDPVSVCISKTPSLCLPCHADADCRFLAGSTDVCVRYDEGLGSFCGGACVESGDCPDGYACVDVQTVEGNPVRQCVSETGACPCSSTAIASSFSTTCAVTSPWGTCEAERVCAEEGLTPCDAATPAAEVCYDQIDNDCDGLTDDEDEDQCEEPCVCGDGVCEPDRCNERWDDQEKTCASDCAVCGDGHCDAGEGPVKCPLDCCGSCGDGVCKGGECGESPTTCPQDCTDYSCGDDLCDPAENSVDCPDDCTRHTCGNHTCEPGEDAITCPTDCLAACGDCVCEGGEAYGTCPKDCGFCGDGYCINLHSESGACPSITAEGAHPCEAIAECSANCEADCCVPDCVSPDGAVHECGDDGCGGLCGTCGTGFQCTTAGVCACAVTGDDADCNGVDDDCNGVPDDHFPVQDTACGVGACERAGTRGCDDGMIVDSCVEGEPTGDDSDCDGIDDDCDGDKDEHFASSSTSCGLGACASTGAMHCQAGAVVDTCLAGDPTGDDSDCNGVDDDCDGDTDEGFVSVSTSCGMGACASTGQTTCSGGAQGDSCVPGQAAANDKTCDGVDDDCDGSTDEGFVVTTTTCGEGACTSNGSRYCVSGKIKNSCTPGSPGTEVCNGVDDDCDSMTDEIATLEQCGEGVCDHWIITCFDGTPYACDPLHGASSEVCNKLDDDCNGSTDEGSTCYATSPHWDIWFSEEYQHSGFCGFALKDEAVIGWRCSGGHCDNNSLRCGKAPFSILGSMLETEYFSEEQDAMIVPEHSVVVGASCQDYRCGEISLFYMTTDVPMADDCYWTPGTVSDEDGESGWVAPDGYYLRGAKCAGNHCDNKYLYFCKP